LNDSAREKLKNFVKNGNRRLSLDALCTKWKEEENQAISSRTIRRNLNKIGIFSHIAQCKPFIFDNNQERRLTWALEHCHWSIEDWKKVLWTDEKFYSISYWCSYSHMKRSRRRI
jgi:Transposase